MQCRRIGSSHQPRIPPTQVGIITCMRCPYSPRFSEPVAPAGLRRPTRFRAHQVLKVRNSGAGSCFLKDKYWFTWLPPCGTHRTRTTSCMMRANDRPVVFSAQCCSRYIAAGLKVPGWARLKAWEGRHGGKRAIRNPRMGTNSTWGGRKWPVRDPCPLVIWLSGLWRRSERSLMKL